MDNLDQLLQSIADDADSRIASLRSDAEKYAKELKADAEAKVREIREESDAASESDAGQMISRAESLIRADRRKAELKRKQEDVDRIITEALASLRNKTKKERVTLYAGIIRNRRVEPGEIVLGKSDRDIGELLIDKLPEGFMLAADTGSFDGGFVIRRDFIEENMTYDLAVRNGRPELAQLATHLIEDENK